MTTLPLKDEDAVRAILFVADLLSPEEAAQLAASLPDHPALAQEVQRLQARQRPADDAGGLLELMDRVRTEEAWRAELLQAHPEVARRAAQLWVALQEVRARVARLKQLEEIAPGLTGATGEKGMS